MNKTRMLNRGAVSARAVWLAATGLCVGLTLLAHAQVGSVTGAERAGR